MSCPFADRDGSYVLGALSPAERLQFEQHLAGCRECSKAVRELAGLPGLLSRVDPEILEHPPADDPLPRSLLPALVREVRRNRRRRTLLTVGAAAAAVVVMVLALAVPGLLRDETPSASAPGGTAVAAPAGRAMMPVGDVPVHASLVAESVAWGTRLDLTCTYAPGPEWKHAPHAVVYVLLVRTSDGRTEQVGTWRSLLGRTMRLTAATAAPRKDITSVEVTTANGRRVLELTA